MIEKFKYNFSQELTDFLARIFIEKIKWLFENKLMDKDILIIPVPLHKKRKSWRGFNQAEVMARKVCEEMNLEFNNDLVKRIKNTVSQVKQKGKIEREKNMQNAFEINKKDIKIINGHYHPIKLLRIGDIN